MRTEASFGLTLQVGVTGLSVALLEQKNITVINRIPC